MIFTERTITVVNDSATINKPLILYRGDKNIELKITIAESQFKFRNTDASNVIETTDASYAQLVINTPYGLPIFSDVAATKNGAVIFVITEAMVDEIREVGAYEIQIRLLDDNKQSRASIPPVSNAIEIREPIAMEDGSAVDSNAVNVAKVNRALTTTSAPLEAFDSQGNYIKKTWGDGDPITDAALNKMEAGIEGVNKKVANNSSQIKDIENYSLVKHTDGKVYIKKQDGTLVGTGVEVGGNTDLSKVTMSMDGQTLKLLNNGTQIATVEIPTAVVTDEQLTAIIQSKIDDGTLSALTIEDNSIGKYKIKIEDESEDWNLLNSSTIIYNKAIAQYGGSSTTTKEGYIYVTIPNIVAGTTYRYTYTGNESKYDIVWIGSNGYSSGTQEAQTPSEGLDYCEATAPNNAVEARFTFRNNNDITLDKIYFAKSSDVGICGKILPNWLDINNNNGIPYTEDLFVNVSVETGSINDFGEVNPDGAIYYVTDYIEVENYNKYTITKSMSNLSTVAVYDTDKNYMYAIKTADVVEPYTFLVNGYNAKYVRICLLKTNKDNFGMFKGTKLVADVNEDECKTLILESNIKAPNLFIDEPAKRFKGKTVIVTGDSITEKNATSTKVWHEYLSDWLGFTVYNDGKSGTGLYKSFQGALGLKDRIEQNWATTYPTNPDIILLHGFMNDGTSGYLSYNGKNWYYLPVGSKDDEAGVNSVYGHLKSVIALLEEKYPLAKLGFICSTPRSQNAASQWTAATEPQDVKCYGHGWFERYIEAYKYLCEEHNIPFLDLYHNSPLKPWLTENAAYYFKEANTGDIGNVHPNAEGHLHAIAYPVYEWLKKYF